MRRIDLTFTALLVPLDFCALAGAAMSAYALRYSQAFVEMRPILQQINLAQYLATAGGFAIIWIVLFWIAGLYNPRPRRNLNELGRVILACTAGTMVIIATVFFRREIATSRFLVLGVWMLSIFYVAFARLALRLIRHGLLSVGIGHQHVAIIGQNSAAMELKSLYRNRPSLGYTVVKQLKDWTTAGQSELEALIKRGELDAVLLADPNIPKDRALDLIAFSANHSLTFRYLADLFAASFTHIDVTTTDGMPIIEVLRTPLDGWGRIFKRLSDILIALIALVLLSPVLLVTFAIRMIEDGLPIIFKNERVGERGHLFNTFKIRSMWRKDCIGPQFKSRERENMARERELIRTQSVKDGPVYKIADDPRVTPLGNFFRRWSLDELPQFWNVLIGDMSIVGPRPHQPREVEQYQPRQRRVLAIKPGITGLAQVSGRSNLEFEDENNLDIWYMENWSILLDLYIIFKTPLVVLNRKGAY